MWRQTTGEYMMQQGPSSFTKKKCNLKDTHDPSSFSGIQFWCFADINICSMAATTQGLHCMLPFGVVPYTSLICCCAALITTKRTCTEGQNGRIGRADWIMGLSPCWTFWKVDFHRSQDDLTVDLLGFTWFLLYKVHLQLSQVVYNLPQLFSIKHCQCLWVNEPCDSFTAYRSSFCFSSGWSGGFCMELTSSSTVHLKCQVSTRIHENNLLRSSQDSVDIFRHILWWKGGRCPKSWYYMAMAQDPIGPTRAELTKHRPILQCQVALICSP